MSLTRLHLSRARAYELRQPHGLTIIAFAVGACIVDTQTKWREATRRLARFQCFKYLGSMTLKNTGSVSAVDIACSAHVTRHKWRHNDSFSAGKTLFSLLLRLVNDTESYSFMMSSSTFDIKTVTVRPSR